MTAWMTLRAARHWTCSSATSTINGRWSSLSRTSLQQQTSTACGPSGRRRAPACRPFQLGRAPGLFAAEESYNRFTLERLSILHNPNLSDEEKTQDIEALRESLPEAMQALLVPQIHQDLRQQTQACAQPAPMKARCANCVWRWSGRMRPRGWRRWMLQRAQWQQRLDDFVRERDAILRQPGLADSDRASAVQALLDARFDSTEQLRVSALGTDRATTPCHTAGSPAPELAYVPPRVYCCYPPCSLPAPARGAELQSGGHQPMV
ncbi:lipase secretion chaperone [Halopseudomonas pachastrellae]|nr:lipase secretion chaperone [Halopseudomonas pachastrellae]